jgi:hypothetical protein
VSLARGRKLDAYAGPSCPHCLEPLDAMRVMTGAQQCGSCGRGFEAVRFAAPRPVEAGRSLGEPGSADETACASHPGNAAASNCERCGVFMCGLCEIEADEMKLCPACFDRLSAEGALPSARTSFRDYGRQASMLALLGVPMMFFGVIIGPAAAFYGVRSLRQLKAMGETGGRARAVLAIVAGLCEATVGVFMLVSMFRA